MGKGSIIVIQGFLFYYIHVYMNCFNNLVTNFDTFLWDSWLNEGKNIPSCLPIADFSTILQMFGKFFCTFLCLRNADGLAKCHEYMSNSSTNSIKQKIWEFHSLKNWLTSFHYLYGRHHGLVLTSISTFHVDLNLFHRKIYVQISTISLQKNLSFVRHNM